MDLLPGNKTPNQCIDDNNSRIYSIWLYMSESIICDATGSDRRGGVCVLERDCGCAGTMGMAVAFTGSFSDTNALALSRSQQNNPRMKYVRAQIVLEMRKQKQVRITLHKPQHFVSFSITTQANSQEKRYHHLKPDSAPRNFG